MTLWDHCCCLGYGLEARASGVWHWLRGHDLHWRGDCVDLWSGHTGCITCTACPDASLNDDGTHADLCIWSRHNTLLWWLTKRLCAWQGHRELRHPERSVPVGDDYAYEPILDQWYCYRCMDDVDVTRLTKDKK